MGSLFPNPAPVIDVAGGKAFISRAFISRSAYLYFKDLERKRLSFYGQPQERHLRQFSLPQIREENANCHSVSKAVDLVNSKCRTSPSCISSLNGSFLKTKGIN